MLDSVGHSRGFGSHGSWKQAPQPGKIQRFTPFCGCSGETGRTAFLGPTQSEPPPGRALTRLGGDPLGKSVSLRCLWDKTTEANDNSLCIFAMTFDTSTARLQILLLDGGCRANPSFGTSWGRLRIWESSCFNCLVRDTACHMLIWGCPF